MRKRPVVILGCGYTGQRVARSLRAAGVPVVATTRSPEKLADLAALGVQVVRLEVLEPETVEALPSLVPEGSRVVHSIPVVDGPLDPTPLLTRALGAKPSRLIYLSTTGVYGNTLDVDETTPPGESEPLRLAAERAATQGSWSTLVLRPAAIYGPGRGVHLSIQRGRYRLVGDGSNFVSRIHVDDLAAHVLAALDSDVTGAWPVADDDPCTSLEMAQFCADRVGAPLPPSIDPAGVHHTRRANRRVNGRAIRKQLGITLRYPSYRTGVPAALDHGSYTD